MTLDILLYIFIDKSLHKTKLSNSKVATICAQCMRECLIYKMSDSNLTNLITVIKIDGKAEIKLDKNHVQILDCDI